MWKPLTRGFDWLLTMNLARLVRPNGGVPRAVAVPNDPAQVVWPKEMVRPRIVPAKSPAGNSPGARAPQAEACWDFSFESPIDCPWEESRSACGLVLGPPDAKRAIIVLHGAYEAQYTHCVWIARTFAAQGYRVLIPAAPCHLQRAPQGVISGSPMFWSTELFVACLHQWLAEVRCLIGWLRHEGTEQVGLFGYSLGSLAAGLAGTLWRDVQFLAMLSPVGSHADSIRQSRLAARIWPWMCQIGAEDVSLLERWSARHRSPLVPQVGFFITQYDQLQPTRLQEEWWQAWGCPPRWGYPHAHLSVHFCKGFYRDLAAFAEQTARLQLRPPQPDSSEHWRSP